MNTSHDLTAYLLGELPEDERAAVERALADSPELRAELDSIRATHDALAGFLAKETGPEPRDVSEKTIPFPAKKTPSLRWFAGIGSTAGAAIAACAVLGAGLALYDRTEKPAVQRADNPPDALMVVQTEKSEARFTLPADKRAPQKSAPVVAAIDKSRLQKPEPENRDLRLAAENTHAGQTASAPTFAAGLASGGVSRGSGGGTGGGEGTGIGIGRGAARSYVSAFGASAPAAKPAAVPAAKVAYESGYVYRPRGEDSGSRSTGGIASANRFDAGVTEQDYVKAAASPLSTFSVDVNTASYAYARRCIESGASLAPESVRIEEWLNNFAYAYPAPEAPHPVSAYVEGSDCPWNADHKLVRIGLRAKSVPEAQRPPSNLVFLIDTSGSMGARDRLPLAQESLLKLLARLDERDRVGIVTYAGMSGIAAEPTVCDTAGKAKLEKVILGLNAAGSTNGAAGLRDAYGLAAKNLNTEGVNRVILATDGDFNVGLSGTAEIVDLAKREAGKKVFLTVLGFGNGNLNADLMKQLSVKADGNHYFIDSLREGERVLAQKLTGTLVTVARDVKIQIDFNPAKVASYRLVGYDTRRLANEDFNDDTKDAGEMGAGHTVTALYEIVPVGATPPVDDSRYVAKAAPSEKPVALSDDWLTVKVRYQPPAGGKSTLIEKPLPASGMKPLAEATPDQRFAAAVAEAALVMRDSKFKGSGTLDDALRLTESPGAVGDDADRKAFADLLRLARHR